MKKGIITFVLGVVTGVAGSYIYSKREEIRDYAQSLMNKGGEAEEIPSDPKGQNAAE